MKTPLLDWTKSPFVALFFAFNELDDPDDLKAEWQDKSNKYRCLYVLDRRFVENEEEMSSVRVLEPKMDTHGRLVSQDGLFTISDYETTIEGEILEYVSNQDFYESLDENDQDDEMAQYICKIYIPNREREECLRFLRKMNIHHASLFPDLIGASQYSNYLIEEFANQKELESQYALLYKVSRDAKNIENEVIEFTEQAKETISRAEDNLQIETSDPDPVDSKIATKRKAEGFIQELIEEISVILDAEDINDELTVLIAKDLVYELQTKFVTDWYKRENILAEIRNTIRSTSRGYDYNLKPWDERIEKIVELLKSKESLRE